MFLRIVESLIITAIGSGFAMYIGVRLLERDVIYNKERMTSHLEEAKNRIQKRDAELKEMRVDLKETRLEILQRLDKIDECIRVRTCTK